MKKNNKIKGISLIVLIVTIIVIIILAGTVILSLAQNNPIEVTNEARLKADIDALKSGLNLYISDQYSDNIGGFDIASVKGKVSEVLPSFPNATDFDTDYEVLGGQLVYKGTDEIISSQASELGVITGLVTVNNLTFNRPDITYLPEATTKAIKWDANNVESQIDLSVAKSDTSWYDYSAKKWANIKTSNNENDAYWVWIPRYAYKLNESYAVIDVKFLAGTTNVTTDGVTLPEGYIIRDAFTFGDKQLTGIWIAKYEASSSTPNALETSVGYTGGANNTALQVRVLPSVYSWRNITTGNAQTVSMNMTSTGGSIGTTVNLDTHQMKSSERAIVTTFANYIYGQKSWINPYGDSTTGSLKLKTGYSGETANSGPLAEGDIKLHPYNDLVYGVNSSTTGNIYGVYDIHGGSWDTLAALYDNGNSSISTYGKTEHILNNKIKAEYEKYYYLLDATNWPSDRSSWQMVGGDFTYGVSDGYNVWGTYGGNKLRSGGFRPILICGLGL
jgi:uncharacterized protein YpmB